jgi:hypothetical protein
MDVIGSLVCLLYPFTSTSLSSVSIGLFKNLEIFLAHLVSRKAKVFALELAKVVVLTLHPLRNKVHRIVKFFPSNSQLKSTYNMSIPFNPKEESSFRTPLFLNP